jgi:hypothetical protein
MSRRVEKGQCATAAVNMLRRQLRTFLRRNFLLSGEAIIGYFFAHRRLVQKEEPSLSSPTISRVAPFTCR